MASSESEVDLDKVLDAAHRIAQYIKRTPVMTCSTLDSMAGRMLHFKCELFQNTGAFKVSFMEQGCRIGESSHLQQSKQCGPHSNPGVDALYWFSPLLREATRGFFSDTPVFPSPGKNQHFRISIWSAPHRHFKRVRTPTCFVGKQITNSYT